MSCIRLAAVAFAAGFGLAAPASAYTINSDAGFDPLRVDGFGTFGLNLLNADGTAAFSSGDADLNAALNSAAGTLTSLVSGYVKEAFAYYIDNSSYNGSYVPGYDILVDVKDLDGSLNTLAQAGGALAVTDLDFVMPSFGVLQVDSTDLSYMKANDILEDVLLHEMIHALGFSGYYWRANDLLGGGFKYIGDSGLAAYEMEYGLGSSFVPLEDDGGPGTVGAHWDEQTFGNNASDSSGSGELMTGYVSASNFLSQTTIFSLQDIGYALGDTVAATTSGDLYYYTAPVPGPAAGGLLASALLGLGIVKRRRRAA